MAGENKLWIERRCNENNLEGGVDGVSGDERNVLIRVHRVNI